ncbi:MAG: RNA polymerase sigma factor SigJ [Chloroflexota bacterium]
MTDPDWLAERFEDHRAHLRGVAYRMLGSLAEAEDVVQDAWLRANRAGAAEVDNLGGWLTTIVARLCLDRLRTRASRREDPAGLELPEPIVTSVDTPAAGVADPERQALLAESIGLAMLIVLDRLTPAERIAFVLHDTFGLPFDEIAPIVERTPTATRQLASRARRRVRGAATPAAGVPMTRQRELVDAFIAAAAAGDFEALVRVLDPEVVVRGDTAAARGPFAGILEVRGARAVAEQALVFSKLAAGARPAIVNGAAGLIVFSGDRPFAVMAFTSTADAIVEIYITLRPDRLARLDLGAIPGPNLA